MHSAIPSVSALAEQEQHTQTLIGVEHGAIHALAQQLPEVNALLETSFEEISATFLTIATQVNAYRDIVNECEIPSDTKEQLAAISSDISNNITKIVMGLQFQDRVSQNLVITINVLNDLLNEWPQGESNDSRDVAFARSVLEKMKLGEVRQRYIDYLMEHGIIDDPSAIGFDSISAKEKTDGDGDDDIDLF